MGVHGKGPATTMVPGGSVREAVGPLRFVGVPVEKLVDGQRAVRPPAASLAKSGEITSVIAGAMLRGERDEGPAGLEQKGFHVGLEPDRGCPVGEVDGPGCPIGDDDEAHAWRTDAQFAHDRQAFLGFVAPHECPGEFVHGGGIGVSRGTLQIEGRCVQSGGSSRAPARNFSTPG